MGRTLSEYVFGIKRGRDLDIPEKQAMFGPGAQAGAQTLSRCSSKKA
jgi:hypothetical protein